MAEICDLAHLIQVEQLRSQAIAQMQLAPYVEDQDTIPTPESAEREFIDWLYERPAQLDMSAEDLDLRDLLIGGRRGGGNAR